MKCIVLVLDNLAYSYTVCLIVSLSDMILILGNLTKEEFNKMKQELEAEYLATFKKTVAMHETFLTRLATHPIFRYLKLYSS